MKYFIDYKLKCLKDRICPMLNEANVMSTAFFPQYVSSLPEDRGAKPPLLPLWPSSLGSVYGLDFRSANRGSM